MNCRNKRKLALSKSWGLGLTVFGEIGRYAFMDVEGVTVVVGTEGGYDIPAIRSYDDAFTAASNAPRLWNQQKRRDDADHRRRVAGKPDISVRR
jgi:hypothetical protein